MGGSIDKDPEPWKAPGLSNAWSPPTPSLRTHTLLVMTHSDTSRSQQSALQQPERAFYSRKTNGSGSYYNRSHFPDEETETQTVK